MLEDHGYILQYSDTFTRVALGFPVDKEILLGEGGPGKVLDEFLRRNGDLEYLKEWIPGECALTHDVEEPIQYFVITKQWEKIEEPIKSSQYHPKYLMDAPEDKLGIATLMLLSLYKGGRPDGNTVGLINTCLFHKMYKEAVQIGEDNDHDIIADIILQQDVKALKHIGLSEREVQAHESLLDGYPNESTVWLDDKLEDDLYEKYYSSNPELSWVLDKYYFRDRKLDVMVEKAKWFAGTIKRAIVCDIDIAVYCDDDIRYPDPSKATVHDINTLSMILFFWTKCGPESISIG
ncbi:hypothetical protein BJ944DRAFT_239959 [Cunninghamella echinulata]|nr:hypothetical protein BJ944DRAFT_239959 [Cunninghamella echinulata]